MKDIASCHTAPLRQSECVDQPVTDVSSTSFQAIAIFIMYGIVKVVPLILRKFDKSNAVS